MACVSLVPLPKILAVRGARLTQRALVQGPAAALAKPAARKAVEVGEGDFFWELNANQPFPKVAADVDVQLAKYKEVHAPSIDSGRASLESRQGASAAQLSRLELSRCKPACYSHNVAAVLLPAWTSSWPGARACAALTLHGAAQAQAGQLRLTHVLHDSSAGARPSEGRCLHASVCTGQPACTS